MENNNKYLSKEELKAYFDKNTPSERLDAIRQKAYNDPFLTEALEGYEAFPQEVPKLAMLEKGLKKKLYRPGFNYAYLLAIPFVAFMLVFWLGNTSKEKLPEIETPGAASHVMEQETQSEVIETGDFSFNTEFPETVSEKAEFTEAPAQLSAKESREKERLHIKAIDKIIPPSVLTVENNGHQKAIKKKRNNFAVTYVLDLKVADYSQRASGNNHSPSNLEARYEFGGDIGEDGNTTMIGYGTFLKETLEKFIAGDYKKALLNFKMIQKHYPNDVNAWFYGGLCHYKLGNYQNAIAFFEKAENYTINIFDEEAEWYRALSLEELNRKEELRPLLEKIISQEGFYAEKAGKVLERVK